jgi:hypothetical protein
MRTRNVKSGGAWGRICCESITRMCCKIEDLSGGVGVGLDAREIRGDCEIALMCPFARVIPELLYRRLTLVEYYQTS